MFPLLRYHGIKSCLSKFKNLDMHEIQFIMVEFGKSISIYVRYINNGYKR